jgi:hypothetical protein
MPIPSTTRRTAQGQDHKHLLMQRMNPIPIGPVGVITQAEKWQLRSN